jgi:hypothetical protein
MPASEQERHGYPTPRPAFRADAARLHALVYEAVSLVLSECEREDEALLADIRKFYLEPQPEYSLPELAALWRISEDDARHIYSDELHRWLDVNEDQPASGFLVRWEDAVGATTVFHLFRDHDVEQALREDFPRLRSETLRTIPVLVRVPGVTLDRLHVHSLVLHRDMSPARLIEGVLADAVRSDIPAEDSPPAVDDLSAASDAETSLQRLLDASHIKPATLENLLVRRLGAHAPSTIQLRRWRKGRTDIRRTRMVQILWALRILTNNPRLPVDQVFDLDPDNPSNWTDGNNFDR